MYFTKYFPEINLPNKKKIVPLHPLSEKGIRE
jgi:hypothetical protein